MNPPLVCMGSGGIAKPLSYSYREMSRLSRNELELGRRKGETVRFLVLLVLGNIIHRPSSIVHHTSSIHEYYTLYQEDQEDPPSHQSRARRYPYLPSFIWDPRIDSAEPYFHRWVVPRIDSAEPYFDVREGVIFLGEGVEEDIILLFGVPPSTQGSFLTRGSNLGSHTLPRSPRRPRRFYLTLPHESMARLKLQDETLRTGPIDARMDILVTYLWLSGNEWVIEK